MKLTKNAMARRGKNVEAENGHFIEGRTCAFVRTVRRILESKFSIDRSLAAKKCGCEIAKKRRTVRAVREKGQGVGG